MFGMTLPTVAFPLALLVAPAKWLWGQFMPRPIFSRDPQKSTWQANNAATQWVVSLSLRRGWLFWKRRIDNCRLYLIRKDWGPNGDPEGIWLKWIEDDRQIESLATTLRMDHAYQSIVVVRNASEGSAYVANEVFIESGGTRRKWELSPGRPPGINDPVGRYEFWLEVRSGKKRWRSKHYYVVTVPPAGQSDDGFNLITRLQYED